MSFLAPLFLLGVLAVALPILFHLTRRSTRRKQPFSSLLFLRPTPPRLTRRNRLEHILLLILRGTVVALLAFAFARPFLSGSSRILPESAPPRRSVVLIDTSASMRRDNLWSDAVSRARQVLRAFAPSDEVALVSYDRAPRVLLRFDQWRAWNPSDRAELAIDRVAGLAPGWAAAHVDLALITAVELIEEADALADHAASRQILLISDLPAGARLNAVQGYDWPDDLEVTVERLMPSPPGNAGLQWIVESDPHAAVAVDPSVPRVRVINSDDAKIEHFQVAWADTPDAAPVHAHVPAGQARVVQVPPRPDDLESAGRLVLRGDPQAFDNEVHVLTPAPDELDLLYIGSDPPEDPRQLLFFLERALTSTGRQTIRLETLAPGQVPSETVLRRKRLVVLTQPVADSIAQSIRRHVESGGTILVVLRDETAPQVLASLYPDRPWRVEEAVVRDFVLLSHIDFGHPVFAPFADPRYSDFSRIHFWRHRRLNLDAMPDVRVVARFDTGDPALLELKHDSGQVLILTAGWHPADGQLALSTKFVPLLHALLEHAGGPRPPLAQYRVGDEVLLPGTGQPPFRITRPDGGTTELDPGVTRFSGTLVPGVYQVAAEGRSWSFAVNLDPAESRTAPVPLDDLERLGLPLQPPARDPALVAAKERELHRIELESRQKLWRWLILTAFLILLIESWLAGRLTRPPAETQGA
jgi:hypothetical protein